MTVAHVAASPMTVRTVNGAISVAADPAKTEVSISADLHAQTLDRLARTKIVATRDADGALRIEVAWADGQRLNSEGCDFDIVAPDVRGIDVDTSNGAIIVTDLGGNALLKSSNGKITATHQAGDVRAATSNGAIVITDPAGNVKAGSSNGAIEVVNAPGARGCGYIQWARRSHALADLSGPGESRFGERADPRGGGGRVPRAGFDADQQLGGEDRRARGTRRRQGDQDRQVVGDHLLRRGGG